MTAKRAVAIFFVTALVMLGIGFASRAPYTPRGADSVLRLSWRLRGEKVQTCRNRSADELAKLPAHMRTPQVCTGHLISYRLIVRVDGSVDSVVFAPAGARADRPIFVLHDVPMTPGTHDVSVEFAPIEKIAGSTRKELRFRSVINARRGHVELVTISPDATRLILLD